MTYTRKYLGKVRNKPEYKNVVQDLVTKFQDAENLTLAEEEFTCGIMKILRDEKGEYKFDISELERCKNYRFRGTYLLYANDLDGDNDIIDFFGKKGDAEKEADTAFLEVEFKEFEKIINGKKGGDNILNYLIDETLHQIKLLDKYLKAIPGELERRGYLYKSIILHAKYIFLLVKEFYQEEGEEEITVDLHKNTALIDSFCYIHTLFRHFAATIKDYQVGKTYHFDQEVRFMDLPSFFGKIITSFSKNCCRGEFNGRSIYLIFNKRKYIIWFRSITLHRGGQSRTYLRLQTFYPTEVTSDLRRMRKLKRVKINSKLSFLVNYA